MTVSKDFEPNVQSVEVVDKNGQTYRVREPFFRGRIINKLIVPSFVWNSFASTPLGASMIPCVNAGGIEITGIYYKKLRKMEL